MVGVRQYLLTLCVSSAVCAVINSFFDSKRNTNKIIRLLTGMFISLCAISPLLNVGQWDLTTFTDRITFGSEAVENGKNMASATTAEFIKEQVGAYVVNKATAMNLDIDVDVKLDDTTQRPCSIVLSGAISPYSKQILSQYITDNLGIAKEDQHWK